MIDLQGYNKYRYNKSLTVQDYSSQNIALLACNNHACKQAKDLIGIIQNLARQSWFANLYFPDLIFSQINYTNQINVNIVPIYHNGKTDNKLFLYLAQRLNDLNFPFAVSVENLQGHAPKIILSYAAYERIIDGKKYSKKNFNVKIKNYQRGFGIKNNFGSAIFFQLKTLLVQKTDPAEIVFYLPKNFSTYFQRPEGAKTTTFNLLGCLKNPSTCIKKPLLYAGAAFLTYTVVKEAAKKHL